MMTPKETVLKLFELLNKDPRGILANDLVSPSATWWSNGEEGRATRTGRKPYLEQALSYIHTSTTYKVNERFEILDIITDRREKVVAEIAVKADGVEGKSTAGKTYLGRMVTIWTVRDGQLVDFREYKDNLASLLFMGEDVVFREGIMHHEHP